MAHRPFADDDTPGFDDNTNQSLDPTNVTDADVYEELTHNIDPSRAAIHDQTILDKLPDVPQDPEELANEIEAGNSETTSTTVIIDQFPQSSAGAPIPGMVHRSLNQESQLDIHADTVWAPFNLQCDWLFAHWAKVHSPTSSAVTWLLEIPKVMCFPGPLFKSCVTNQSMKIVDTLGLLYRNIKQLNNIIDTKIPGCPHFQCKELVIGYEHLKFYCRDVIECIRSLYGDPRFAQELVFAPERHYTDHERTCQIYNKIYMGDWWWLV